jgi:hypothetical protein
MANELTLSASLLFVNGTKRVSFSKSGLQFTVSGNDYIAGTQTVGTSEEALAKGDITTPGFCFIFNRDATNFVKVRGASGAVDCIKIKPGEFAMFRHAGTAPYVIADTGACEIEYVIIED